MFDSAVKYLPASVFAVGAAITALIGTPQPTPLRKPLPATIPATWMNATKKDVPITADEVEKSGVSDYINWNYFVTPDLPVNLYIGYHATQQGDKRMHSPSLCLPGSGWTPVGESIVAVPMAGGAARVNRFVLQNGKNRILVYYWFQGRGRITAGQGDLKLNAMRDALVSHRDEEALVRIVVPMTAGDREPTGTTGLLPDTLATRLASAVITPVQQALPPAP